MKKVFSYMSLFVCAFMLFGSMLTANAAEYDVYEAGETITKQMTSGKNVSFTVVEDEGVNSQYVRVIANPRDLAQFDVKTAYSYDDITAAISSGEWAPVGQTLVDTLGKLWASKIKLDDTTKITIFSKKDYVDFKDIIAKEASNVDEEMAKILKGQTFWAINLDDSNTLGYDRVVDGAYVNTEMTDKTAAINLTVEATICKEPKKICKYDETTKKYYGSKGEEVTAAEYQKQCGNPDTADNNVFILSLIGAGCVLCIIGFARKILA